jgi:hypothetical protein
MIQLTCCAPTHLDPADKSLWTPVNDAIKTTKACFSKQECSSSFRARDASTFCQHVQQVEQLMRCNYKNYVKIFKDKCDKNGKPVELTDDLLVNHIYGFTPFVEGGCPADANLLADTPGYKDNKSQKYHTVKEQDFDVLQRWKAPLSDPYPAGAFNPWWLLIHANKKDGYPRQYANIANAYAYSVDDAVGNLQADGTGFFVAVGGTKGLPKPVPAETGIIVGLGYSKKDPAVFTKYTICGSQPNVDVKPNFPGFVMNVLQSDLSRCTVTLIDSQNQTYKFKVKASEHYPLDPDTDKSRAMIDCSDNPPNTRVAAWCSKAFAYAIQMPHGDEVHAVTPPACKNTTGNDCQ